LRPTDGILQTTERVVIEYLVELLIMPYLKSIHVYKCRKMPVWNIN
jgi:hypothetical protein